MHITIQAFGLPTLKELLGDSCRVEFSGKTLTDLLEQLTALHGDRLRHVLLDENGGLDMGIQVMINKKKFVRRKDFSRQRLRDGDTVFFMMLAAGG